MNEQPTILCQFEMALTVSAVVWADFCTLREKWGECCVNGFYYDCERYVQEAVKTGDLVQALHWRAVTRLATIYADAPFCAIEVDGKIIREIVFPDGPYPPDTELHRVEIGALVSRSV